MKRKEKKERMSEEEKKEESFWVWFEVELFKVEFDIVLSTCCVLMVQVIRCGTFAVEIS